jgi:SAM-dependent methyltransferase
MTGKLQSNESPMHSRISDFIAARAAETYPEPRTTGHDGLTAQMAPLVAAMLPTGASVLDVGCGQGPALDWFQQHGHYPVGITTNTADLRACEANGHEVHPVDMHKLPDSFERYPFDCIWARHVLEHSAIPFFVLHEFARVLKPGGILYAEVPSPGTACGHETNPNHYSVLGSTAWINLISRAGFEIIEAREIKLQTGAGPDIYYSFIAKKK